MAQGQTLDRHGRQRRHADHYVRHRRRRGRDARAIADRGSGPVPAVNGTVNTANGDVTLTAINPTDSITLGGTASATKFGIENLSALPANGTVIGNDVSTFTAQSTDGGSITAYDSEGNPVNVQFRWAQVSSSSAAVPGSCFTRPIPARPAPRRRGKTSARRSRSTPTANCRRRSPSLTLQNLTVERRHARQRAAHLRHQRAHPVRRHQRHGAGQPAAAERLRRRPTGIDRGRQPGPHHRVVLQRADHSARGDHAGDVQRPGFARRRSTAAPMRRRRNPARRSTAPPAPSSAARSKPPTSISPRNSAI